MNNKFRLIKVIFKKQNENELQYCIGIAKTAVPGNFTATSSNPP